ncbi:MAG: hypothetical protein KDA84_24270 [Planctomycetaceae bacterium]|nr:hypothetical protein [Planctomycetaceae bacterium]
MILFAQSDRGLTLPDHVVIGIYLLSMLIMGLWIAFRQRSTDDFFLGGRNLPSWAVGISLLASLLSTITYLGMPGEMFRTGLGFLTRQLGVPIVLVVVWFIFLPFFMRMKLTSAYEYLENRFNYSTRAIAAVFCILLLLGWMSVVVLTASKAMAEIALLDLDWFFGVNHPAEGTTPEYRDADLHALILSIGLFSVLYTTLGGLRAVVWTDVVQFFILVGGAIYTIGYIAFVTNSGFNDWLSAFQEYPHRESVEWVSLDIGNRSTVCFITVGMAFWFICTHGANQVALQRYFSVKDLWAARRSYLVSAIASFVLGVLLAGVGLSLLYFIRLPENDLPAKPQLEASLPETAPDTEHAKLRKARTEAQDKLFPQFISSYLPWGMRGMVVAALFAAAMSTIDSGANSISTIVTVDFVRRFRVGQSADAVELRLARCLTAAMGIIIVAVTIFLYHISKGTDIISLTQKGFNCFLGPLGALFVLGMFSKRATAATVIPSVLLGEVVGISTSYSEELFGRPFSTHLVVPTSWLATIVCCHLLNVALRTRADESQSQWLWGPVVRSSNEDDEK